jgi:hypothetical protein
MTASSLRWIVPQAALGRSYAELAADGALDREGIALWGGVAEPCAYDHAIRVTHVILLRGPGVVRGMGYIGISPELLNDVTDALAALDGDVYLVGQIHGHPTLASTDLSEVDIAYGSRTPHYLSVVAPDYGMARVARLAECGVHVFEPRGGWRRFAPAEVVARVAVPSHADGDVTCLTVGAETDE